MLGEKEAQSKWGGPRLPGEDALGEGADLAGLRGLGVTLNTGEGGRRGGAPTWWLVLEKTPLSAPRPGH